MGGGGGGLLVGGPAEEENWIKSSVSTWSPREIEEDLEITMSGYQYCNHDASTNSAVKIKLSIALIFLYSMVAVTV